MTQQRENACAVRPTAAPKPGGLFRADSLNVVHAGPEQLAWAAGSRQVGRQLLPDRGTRLPPQPLLPGDLAGRLETDTLLIARTPDRPVGVCWLGWQGSGPWRFLPARAAYVTDLTVTQGALSKAVAGLLLLTAVRTGLARGRRVVRLSCDASNQGLCAYLASVGFSQLGLQRPPGRHSSIALFERGR